MVRKRSPAKALPATSGLPYGSRTGQLLTEVQLLAAERLSFASRTPGVSYAGLESARGSSICLLPCQIVVVLSTFVSGPELAVACIGD